MLELQLIQYLGLGLLLVSVIDAIGSILSRIYQFNYAAVAIASVIAYIGIALVCFTDLDPLKSFVVLGIMALYDATIGYQISVRLKAFTGDIDLKEIDQNMRVLSSVLFASICYGLSYAIHLILN